MELEVTICDFQFYQDGLKKKSLCFYRIGSGHAKQYPSFKISHSSKHQHHACIRCRTTDDFLSDQNDINEETAMQLELINQSLAELQMKRKKEEKPRNPIGFIKPKT